MSRFFSQRSLESRDGRRHFTALRLERKDIWGRYIVFVKSIHISQLSRFKMTHGRQNATQIKSEKCSVCLHSVPLTLTLLMKSCEIITQGLHYSEKKPRGPW